MGKRTNSPSMRLMAWLCAAGMTAAVALLVL